MSPAGGAAVAERRDLPCMTTTKRYLASAAIPAAPSPYVFIGPWVDLATRRARFAALYRHLAVATLAVEMARRGGPSAAPSACTLAACAHPR